MPLKFYLDKRKNKYGESPIRIVWSFNGDRYQTTMGFSVPPTAWDDAIKRVTPAEYNHRKTASSTINDFIEAMERAVLRVENYARIQNAAQSCGIDNKRKSKRGYGHCICRAFATQCSRQRAARQAKNIDYHVCHRFFLPLVFFYNSVYNTLIFSLEAIMRKKRLTTQKIAQCGLLTAVMLVLGFIESLIPITVGVPGIKLGLSNGVLLFALYMMDAPTAFVLMVLKVILSGLLFGGVSAMMYAFAGGLLSMMGMILLKKMNFSILAVSMAGGVLHNVGQVLLAMIILQTSQLLYYMAILLFVGLACGAITGIAARATISHMKKLNRKS